MRTNDMPDRMRGLRVIALPLCGILRDCNMCDADGRDKRLEFCEPEHANLTFQGIANILFLAVTIQFPEIDKLPIVRNEFFETDMSYRDLKRLIFSHLGIDMEA